MLTSQGTPRAQPKHGSCLTMSANSFLTTFTLTFNTSRFSLKSSDFHHLSSSIFQILDLREQLAILRNRVEESPGECVTTPLTSTVRDRDFRLL
ncbi:hypothetical protein L1987_06261 [Smallanthus sonchifolius]|uniref:Uncharacterized protein n=1 Tax=Smallanthus sonchifolius TaxID=185202 RepID=A0ACB9JXM8_9ASTR|nr:hypothetical protein L1987_06261 [Smallanthus sonchifolius]